MPCSLPSSRLEVGPARLIRSQVQQYKTFRPHMPRAVTYSSSLRIPLGSVTCSGRHVAYIFPTKSLTRSGVCVAEPLNERACLVSVALPEHPTPPPTTTSL